MTHHCWPRHCFHYYKSSSLDRSLRLNLFCDEGFLWFLKFNIFQKVQSNINKTWCLPRCAVLQRWILYCLIYDVAWLRFDEAVQILPHCSLQFFVHLFSWYWLKKTLQKYSSFFVLLSFFIKHLNFTFFYWFVDLYRWCVKAL